MRQRRFLSEVLFALLFSVAQVGFVYAQTTTFTYQGRFTDGGTAANGTYDMQFKLFDGAGTQIGSTITNGAVTVTNGVFTVQLDYSAASFPGADRFIEIGVRPAGSSDGYTVLSPRQPLTSTPYAIRSLTADSATNATQLNGVDGSQFVKTSDARLSDERTPTAGSSNYIQNTTNQQSANFNISGNGVAAGVLSAGALNAVTQYNLGGDRFMTGVGTNTSIGRNVGASPNRDDNAFFGSVVAPNNNGDRNSFFGALVGSDNTDGRDNSFFGYRAGRNNTNGHSNSYFGGRAGEINLTGQENSFFGYAAGQFNKGSRNSFFGFRSGLSNDAGEDNSYFGFHTGVSATSSNNSFFGAYSGLSVTTNGNNAFFGAKSGYANTAGGNSFFGSLSGTSNTTGNNNAFFGAQSGYSNSVGSNNSFFGALAGFLNTTNGVSTGNNNSFFGALAGQNNSTASDNSFFGNSAGRVNNTGKQNSFFGSGAGELNKAGQNSFFGAFAGQNNNDGINNSFFGNQAGKANTSGGNNVFIGDGAGFLNTTGGSNTFVGRVAGISNTTGKSNTLIGDEADVDSAGLDHATAIGADATVATSNTIALGRSNGSDGVRVPGTLTLGTLGLAGATSLCRNLLNQISGCSSSLRYKTNIRPFMGGLSVLNRLRPITFDWKQGGMHDLGFGAEDIAAVEPLLITRNDKGEVEGVKYDRITAVLVNAVKEQQAQITRQQDEIAGLKRLMCKRNRRAAVCR